MRYNTSSIKCDWCGITRAKAYEMYSYTCEKHNIGYKSEKFTGGLLPISLCNECLESHILKKHAESHWAKCLREKKRSIGSTARIAMTPEEIQRLEILLAQLKGWREELYELLTDKQKERLNELDKREG